MDVSFLLGAVASPFLYCLSQVPPLSGCMFELVAQPSLPSQSIVSVLCTVCLLVFKGAFVRECDCAKYCLCRTTCCAAFEVLMAKAVALPSTCFTSPTEGHEVRVHHYLIIGFWAMFTLHLPARAASHFDNYKMAAAAA